MGVVWVSCISCMSSRRRCSGRILPYTFTVTLLSGGSDGLESPKFLTNSAGKICVDPNLNPISDATAGSQYNDDRFYVELWRDNTTDDYIGTHHYEAFNEPNKCFTGLQTNKKHYIRLKKTKFVRGNNLGGNGVIKYS